MTQTVRTGAERARQVGDQARSEAQTAAHDLKGRIGEEADSRTHGAAGAVRRWADDLAGLADNAPDDSPARGLVAQAADRGHQAADYIDRRGFDGLVDEVQTFARRRPAAFLGGAILAGFALGRVVKGGRADGAGGPEDTEAYEEPEAPGDTGGTTEPEA
ncbi:hypothetical protein [Streptomyces sp. SBT349]|uniref:hypothetical protein n=1 Tax=Streptomyces sp. SBT349 TaxID=1580539 RepID=UPI00069E3EC8|nr:hypothetical protein [Streptomyces sp. SBT349]